MATVFKRLSLPVSELNRAAAANAEIVRGRLAAVVYGAAADGAAAERDEILTLGSSIIPREAALVLCCVAAVRDSLTTLRCDVDGDAAMAGASVGGSA